MIEWGAAETLRCPADSAPGSLGDLGTLFVLGEVQVSAVQTTGFSAESSTKLALNERQGHRPLQHFLFFVLFCFFNRAHLLEFKMLWRKSNSHLRKFCDGVRCVCNSM